MDLIIDELKLNDEKVNKLNSQTKKKLSLKNNIKVDKLCFRYNETEDWILHNISFQVNKGEMVGFVGESGSGKSTLIDILTGLQEPHSGSIKIDNNDIRKDISALAEHCWICVPECILEGFIYTRKHCFLEYR